MELKVSKNDIILSAKIFNICDDLVIFVYGGDTPHVGSSVLANIHEIKSISFKNHKDDIALKIIAKKILKKSRKNVCLVGGIHIDDIKKEQIGQILKMCKKLGKKIAKIL